MRLNQISISIKDTNNWNKNTKNIFICLLGIPEACQLEQVYTSNIWTTIFILEQFKLSELPYWMNPSTDPKKNYKIINELKKLAICFNKPEFKYKELYIPEEFTFFIKMPKETPFTNKDEWIKWCFAIKLLYTYTNNTYPMDFLALRGMNEVNLGINKEFAKEFLLNHLSETLPKPLLTKKGIFPQYLPPYLEMDKREYLWSLNKRQDILNMRKLVWFHVLANIANSEEVNKESILKGINVLINIYKESKNQHYLEIIGNCLGLTFASFPYK